MEENNHQNCHKKAEIAVVMVPFPAQGHLNQLLHLSHLLTTYSLPVHYAASATHNRQAKHRLHGWDPQTLTKIHFHDLEIPPFPNPNPNPNQSTNTHFPAHLHPVFEASLHLRQPVFKLVQELVPMTNRVVVIHDSIISSVVQDVISIPNVETYAFLPTCAFTLFLALWDDQKPFQFDSSFAISSVPSREGCHTQLVEEFINYQHKFLGSQSGRLYNSSRVIEGKYVELFEKLYVNNNQKHFVIGPFNPVLETKQIRHGCLEWLDKQDEKDSVIYVSFGSTTSMNDEQIKELAIGLERSGEKFIWVLRNADKCDVFEGDEGRKPKLPEGYEDRVRNRGLVVREWAPQLGILAHPSIGGFVSHCGWNSCLEGITMGVPIAAWPMHSDQPRNAFMLTEVLRIGTMVRDWADRMELVTSNTIKNVVRRLMASDDGAEMRRKAKELGDEVRGSVAKGGTSQLEMEAFIAHITR